MRHLFVHATVAGAWDYAKRSALINPPVIRLAWIIHQDDSEVEACCHVYSIESEQSLSDLGKPRHGITRGYLTARGFASKIPDIGIMGVECQRETRLVGFGIQFIQYVIDRERIELGMEPLSWMRPIDVMVHAAPIVQTRLVGRGGWAFPKYTVACAHFGLDVPAEGVDPIDAGMAHVENIRTMFQRIREQS